MLKRWRLPAIGLAAAGLLIAGLVAVQMRLAADHALNEMKAEYVRPSGPAPAPEDNQSTPARVELGRQLFFDTRLSGDGAMSCATCHAPDRQWQDGVATAIGRDGRILGRRTPTILNAAWGSAFFWDGRADTLEQQAVMPIQAAGEMNLPHAEAVARIAAIPGYRQAFAESYGEDVTITSIGQAIAAFERTLVSGQAPFDRWIAGDTHAISEDAQRGFVLFNTRARCSTCHASWRFTDDGFHDIGVSDDDDEGRAAIAPGIEQLRFAFKTPTLRNIEQRGPYMHNGSLQSLEAVVAFYNAPPRVRRPSLSPDLVPLGLSVREQEELVAFLRTLTSEDAHPSSPTLPQ